MTIALASPVLVLTACGDRTTQVTATGPSIIVTTTAALRPTVPSLATLDAENEIRRAFSLLMDTSATQAERDAAVEDGERTSTERAARFEQHRERASRYVFAVDAIDVVSDTEASVRFHLQMRDQTLASALAGSNLTGRAVWQGGHWRVSLDTLCLISTTLGNMPCVR